MASANVPKFDFDAIILHSNDDFENVVKFCEKLKKELDLGLRIVAFKEFGSPAKTDIANWDEAVIAARFIFVSEHHYYTDQYGNFFSNVAMLEKIPDKLVKVSTSQIAEETPCMKAFTGIQLTQNWGVTSHTLQRLESLFRGDTDIVDESEKDASGHTVVENAGSSELLFPDQYNQQELPSKTILVVANPSLPATGDSFGAPIANDDETEPKMIYPKTGPPLPAPATERVHPEARPDPVNGQSSALPEDDLEEDSGEVVASEANTTNEPHLQAHEAVFTAEGPAVSHHRSEADGNPAAHHPPSTERDRPVPGRSGNSVGPISGGRLEGIRSEENAGAPRGLEDRVVLGAENSLAQRSREGRRAAGDGENRPVPCGERGGAGGSLGGGLTHKGRDSSEGGSDESRFPNYVYAVVGLAITLGMVLAICVKNK